MCVLVVRRRSRYPKGGIHSTTTHPFSKQQPPRWPILFLLRCGVGTPTKQVLSRRSLGGQHYSRRSVSSLVGTFVKNPLGLLYIHSLPSPPPPFFIIQSPS